MGISHFKCNSSLVFRWLLGGFVALFMFAPVRSYAQPTQSFDYREAIKLVGKLDDLQSDIRENAKNAEPFSRTSMCMFAVMNDIGLVSIYLQNAALTEGMLVKMNTKADQEIIANNMRYEIRALININQIQKSDVATWSRVCGNDAIAVNGGQAAMGLFDDVATLFAANTP